MFLLLTATFFSFIGALMFLNFGITLLLGYYCYRLHISIYDMKITVVPQIEDVINTFGKDLKKMFFNLKKINQTVKILEKNQKN